MQEPAGPFLDVSSACMHVYLGEGSVARDDPVAGHEEVGEGRVAPRHVLCWYAGGEKRRLGGREYRRTYPYTHTHAAHACMIGCL